MLKEEIYSKGYIFDGVFYEDEHEYWLAVEADHGDGSYASTMFIPFIDNSVSDEEWNKFYSEEVEDIYE